MISLLFFLASASIFYGLNYKTNLLRVLKNNYRINRSSQQTEAVVTHVDTRTGSDRSYDVSFRYEVDGEPFQGTSFIKKRTLAQGDKVEIEYCPNFPRASRMRGSESLPFSSSAFVAPFFFLGISVLCFFLAREAIKNRMELLKNGTFVVAFFTGQSVKVNRASGSAALYKSTFRAPETEGSHWFTTTGFARGQPKKNDRKTLLVDPGSPGSRGMDVDTLLKRDCLGADGYWQASRSYRGYVYLSLLVLGVVLWILPFGSL